MLKMVLPAIEAVTDGANVSSTSGKNSSVLPPQAVSAAARVMIVSVVAVFMADIL